jgi:hypothetical protein
MCVVGTPLSSNESVTLVNGSGPTPAGVVRCPATMTSTSARAERRRTLLHSEEGRGLPHIARSSTGGWDPVNFLHCQDKKVRSGADSLCL